MISSLSYFREKTEQYEYQGLLLTGSPLFPENTGVSYAAGMLRLIMYDPQVCSQEYHCAHMIDEIV